MDGRQFFQVDDMTVAEEEMASALIAANRVAAKAKADLAAALAYRYDLEPGTLKVYARWGKISAEVVEAPVAKASKAKLSLGDYLARQAANGRSS